jgi:hypothetical protein
MHVHIAVFHSRTGPDIGGSCDCRVLANNTPIETDKIWSVMPPKTDLNAESADFALIHRLGQQLEGAHPRLVVPDRRRDN